MKPTENPTQRTSCDCRDWLANQQCPHVKPFDGLTPEALRSAADVIELCWIKMFGQIIDKTPGILRAEADRMERAARDDLAFEELAERGYEAWRSIYPVADVEGPPQWCDVSTATEQHWLSWAREMRKDEA